MGEFGEDLEAAKCFLPPASRWWDSDVLMTNGVILTAGQSVRDWSVWARILLLWGVFIWTVGAKQPCPKENGMSKALNFYSSAFLWFTSPEGFRDFAIGGQQICNACPLFKNEGIWDFGKSKTKICLNSSPQITEMKQVVLGVIDLWSPLTRSIAPDRYC